MILSGLNNRPLPISPSNRVMIPTYGELLASVIGNSLAKTPGDAKLIVDLCRKIAAAEADLTVDDQELKVLGEYVCLNQIKLSAILQGQLLMMLEQVKV